MRHCVLRAGKCASRGAAVVPRHRGGRRLQGAVVAGAYYGFFCR